MEGSRTHTHTLTEKETHSQRKREERQTEYAELKEIHKINDKVKELPFIV